jgi:hypothetical protein
VHVDDAQIVAVSDPVAHDEEGRSHLGEVGQVAVCALLGSVGDEWFGEIAAGDESRFEGEYEVASGKPP